MSAGLDQLASPYIYSFLLILFIPDFIDVLRGRKRSVSSLLVPMAEDLYSREQIELWQSKLEAISQKPRTMFTKKQAVEELIDTLEKALETRSFEEVATGLKEWGLDISAGSLKQYVTRYRRSHRAASSRKGASHTKKKGGVRATAQVDSAAAEGKSNEKPGSSSKPSRFLEMAEDL